ncbi:MAG: gliding motility-associated C-terminal domain-containing protein [Saprospiraceae bacterium]|nr:MAG: laminin G sub domain 2 [Bacteroidetes bacterium OLB9]MCO6463814.1 gliding motility-associated C-terminal domain-containing protein [Saprospiraceae bacterium]
MKKLIFLPICILYTLAGFSQNAYYLYNFDNCGPESSVTDFPDILLGGDPQCRCGIGENGIFLDGQDDYLQIDKATNVLFSSDFTLDFYFMLSDPSGELDIMSLRNECGRLDSMMQLRYFSNTNELIFEMSSNINNYFGAKAQLDKTKCWHRFTVVKFNLEYYAYLDNKLIGNYLAKENIALTKQGDFFFANNPCNSLDVKKMKGIIDELTLHKRALSEQEIIQSFVYPDRIITKSTTIFKGESITLATGDNCANSIVWTPATSLNDAGAASPTATPEETTTYRVVFHNNTCTSTDSITIYVTDKEKLDCQQLLLPKAFTPNNDGLNDVYGISNTFIVDELESFEIYDRWGEKVWSTQFIDETWDGTKNNSPVNGGTYLYKIKYRCNNSDFVKIDNFTLLR